MSICLCMHARFSQVEKQTLYISKKKWKRNLVVRNFDRVDENYTSFFFEWREIQCGYIVGHN